MKDNRKLIIMFAILLVAIPFGVLGICISKVITSQVAVLMNTYYTGKLFKFGYFAQVRDIYPYLLCSIVATLPAYMFTFLDLAPIVPLLFGCLTAPFIYWVLLRNDSNMIELISITKNKMNSIKK